MNEQARQRKTEEEQRESGLPGGDQGRTDKVGESNVYPVSEMEGADNNAVVRAPASLGDGENEVDYQKESSEKKFLTDKEVKK